MKSLPLNTGYFLGGLACLTLVANLLYLGWFRQEVSSIYEGRLNGLSALIHGLYPQFQVEKQRLSLQFFLNKADQVVLRANLILLFFAVITVVLPGWWVRFTGHLSAAATSPLQVKVLRLLYFMCVLGFVKDWPVYLQDYQAFRAFYEPLPILGLIALPYPSEWVIILMGVLLFQGGIFAALGLWPIWHAVQTFLLCTLFNAYLQGFGKTDHAWVIFGYAGMFMPFLLWNFREAKNKKIGVIKAWPLRWIQLCVALGYLMSGLEKLSAGTWAWLSGEQLEHYIYRYHPNALGFFPGKVLPVVATLLVLAFQLTFWMILRKKEWTSFFLMSGIIFHFSTVWFLGVGAVASPWVAVYIFFINWEKLLCNSNFTKGNELITK